MRKIFLLVSIVSFLFLINFSFTSALQIQTYSNYSKGENFVAKVAGTFYVRPNVEDNVFFYRDNLSTSFDKKMFKLDDHNYIIYFNIPLYKQAGEYSLIIYDGRENTTKNFDLMDKSASFQIIPAFYVPLNSSYNLTLKNLKDKPVEINYGLKGTEMKSINLSYLNEEKNVTLETYGGNKFENVLFSTTGENYSLLVYSNLSQTNFPNNDQTVNKTNGTKDNNTDGGSFWDFFGGSDNGTKENGTIKQNQTNFNQTNETNQTNNTVGNSLQTCDEMSLPICQSNETCDGSYVDGQDAQCCNGNCVAPKEKSSAWGTIGWILIGIVVLFLAWFFLFKFKKARRTPGKLFKK